MTDQQAKKRIEALGEQLLSSRKLVSFDSYDITVRQLLEMFGEKTIFVPPEYQRQFIWNEERQSHLVESVLLGIPVPSLYMATNKDSTWELVDGVQRIGSLAHFVGGKNLLALINKPAPLVIEGLEKLDTLNGFAFDEVPKPTQLFFYNRPLRVTVLNDKSDTDVRFDLFERLNTGGVTLTPQEIRNCIFRGPFNDTLKTLAKQQNFRSVIKLRPADQDNGTREEFVLRFFAFVDEYKNFDHSVTDFLNKYARDNAEKPPSKSEVDLFTRTFALLSNALPNGISRGRNLTPVNLFEAISVGVALALKSGKSVAAKKLVGIMTSKELRGLTTGATNNKKMVTGRIELVRDAL